ncbi:heavy-metal-associated domain-containing protein [Flavobacterium pallidum]|uniref:Heavy metal transporter n=1 Tax=Flavobacterium pallidum TaxID=2172098 RepID=A0A2S1SEM6_9FLAO|nr:heavy metal-associated domain-containing protein [Flavobacterium pallidum]AWI24866.1 heavy metal transporter [Flavobacterium pallidum]
MKITKSILSLALAAMLFTACKQNASEAATPAKDATATIEKTEAAVTGKMETASFKIEGMSCAVMCASKIEKELSAMEGVKTAKVDFEKKTATVEYDNALQTPQKLADKVESVADGKTYKVSDIKSTADHAMLFKGDQEKPKKTKASKKAKKAETTEKEAKACDKDKAGAKPGCCAAKKHCSEGGKM